MFTEDYISRDIDLIIEKWDESKQKALMVLGARQIGKTHSIEHFLAKKQNVEVNKIQKLDLSEDSEGITIDYILNKKRTPNLSIVEGIFANVNKQIDNEECDIVFIDEIQFLSNKNKKVSNKKIRDAIRYILEDDKYRVIFSGSLLGSKIIDIDTINLEIKEIQIVRMYPISFIEFVDIFENVKNISKQAFKEINKGQVDINFHIKMLTYFAQYSFVGGMPDSVFAFIKTKKAENAYAAIKDLSNLYYSDVEKYCETNKVPFQKEDLFRVMYEGLRQQNKESYISKNFKEDERQQFYSYVLDSDVGLLVPHISDIGTKNEKTKRPKCYFNDVGFLRHVIREQSLEPEKRDNDILLNGYVEYFNGNQKSDRPSNDGYVFEQIIAQDFKARALNVGYYYWKEKKHERENEFMFPEDNITIEVKSGGFNDYKSAKESSKENKVIFSTMMPYIQKVSDTFLLVPVYYLCLFSPTEIVGFSFVSANKKIIDYLEKVGRLSQEKGFVIK